VTERFHEECQLVSGLNQAERAVSAVVQQRLAELRAVHEKVG
jgi:hypothetical protein